MAYQPEDNIELVKDKWVLITDKCGLLHFKYAPQTVIYLYEGCEDPNTLYTSPDKKNPLAILTNNGNVANATIGQNMRYSNKTGALWAYSEGYVSYVLKINTKEG